MNLKFNLICIIVILTSSSATAVQRPITSEDFYSIKEISDCQVSPDGKVIAYVQQQIDKENNCYISNIWLISLKRGTIKQLTTSLAQDSSPCWSPDSKYIAFVSNRSGVNQIWVIDTGGGEAWALTNMPNGANSPAWSPDATRIAFLSHVRISNTNNQKKNLPITNNKGKDYATDVKVITNLKYRSHTKYFDEKYAHIFVININGKEIKQLTYGNYHDSAPVWSPDSKFIAFSSNRRGDLYFDDNSDIYMVPSGGGKIKQLTAGPGPEKSPLWSPDGNYICYLGKTAPNNYAQQNDLWLINIYTKENINLTANFDRIPFKAKWSSRDGKKIYFLAADYGNVHLFSTHLKNHKAEKVITGRRQLKSYQILANKKVAFIASENNNPGDLYLANLSTKNEKRLTYTNQKFLNTLYLSKPEEFFYKSFDNTKIHGWIMKPVPFSAAKKYPLVVEIHGGPHWYYGNCWVQEFQILAAQGYVVFYCNPRLSTGYGQKFAKLGIGQWGEGDYEDIMAGVNYITKLSYVDSTKLFITGGSYGGFMTNWIIGHTNRFKAAVTQRSLANLVSFYGTTDIQSFIEFEFGLSWENLNNLNKHSPINYAENINTPLLIIHSELDYRVPISQAEELFTILKRRNITVEFVRYPAEGHELSRRGQPVHRVDRYNRIIDWFNKY